MIFKRSKKEQDDTSTTRESDTQRKKRTRLVKIKIPVDELTLGMQIAELDRPWTEVPVLFQGFPLQNQEDLDTLAVYCNHVYVELDEDYWETIKHDYPSAEYKQARSEAEEAHHSLHQELPRAERIFKASKKSIKELLDAVKNNKAINIDESKQLVSECVTSILANPNAMFWLSRIKDSDEYTSEHCLRVSIMAIAFGQILGFSHQELENIGMCGLLHDVGKMKIPPEILNKPGPLSDDEFKVMKEHTVLGYIFLKQHGGFDEMVSDVAHAHHERVDGKGYPQRLESERIGLYPKIIGIIDAYDAITSDRSFRDGMAPLEALGILFKERGTHFDTELVEKFIQMVGIYPPGSLVEMTNGETGIVLAANPDQKLKPKIEIILDSKGNFRRPIVIDLTKEQYDQENNLYAIKKPLRDSSRDINLEDFIRGNG